SCSSGGTPWLRLWRWYESARRPGGPDRGALGAPPEEQLTARQRVEQAVRTVADDAADGLPGPWAQAVREAAVHGAQGLPEALDELAGRAAGTESRGADDSGTARAAAGVRGGTAGAAAGVRGGTAQAQPGRGSKPPRPAWWPAAVLAQVVMTLLQIFGGLWLAGQIIGVLQPGLLTPALVMLAGIIGGPLVEWSCAAAARGPARRYGQEAERRLRETAAACGRARVLDPVSAELVRYREVRERFVAVTEFSTTSR
ncbi:ATP-binding protein, partial [Streptomyces sp. P01-B04]|nr:ATP-binding protein [Streptomyces poriferorum]